jgi:hypothetical protein
MSRFCLASALLVTAAATAQPPVTTSQYDSARTGANTGETLLTAQNVNARDFGKLFAFPVDGAIFAQPLYLPAIDIPGKGVHDIVFVATEHDSVYAFDARGQTSFPLWHVSFANPGAGVNPVPARDVACPFIYPEVGITSTPVIDYATGTLYVLARTKERRSMFRDEYTQKLHALAITTGVEKFGGPVTIGGSVSGRANQGSNTVAFEGLRENPRAALLLAGGRIYLTWASSCDVGSYFGWVMAYDAHTLKQVGLFNASPDAAAGGIWLSDTGPAADTEGNIFVVTGNGWFNAATGGRDYGDSILKLHLDGGGLQPADYFTPFNQQELNSNDDDLGSGGPVLLPDQAGPHRHLLLAGGKGGVLYLVDRDRMGKYRAGADSHAMQTLRFPGTPLFGAPAYWNGHVYVIAASDVIRDFAVKGGRLIPAVAGGLPEVSGWRRHAGRLREWNEKRDRLGDCHPHMAGRRAARRAARVRCPERLKRVVQQRAKQRARPRRPSPPFHHSDGRQRPRVRGDPARTGRLRPTALGEIGLGAPSRSGTRTH